MRIPLISRWLTALLCLATLSGQAQYQFRDSPVAAPYSAGLAAYRQNFDALANTNAKFTSNSTLPGVYARYKLDGYSSEYESWERGAWNPDARLSPDNGSEGTNTNSTIDNNGTVHGPAWYHFGATGAADRALGGIAGTSTYDGQGAVGIRLKNSSSKTIVNLEVEYAMEQWYNSSRTQAATVQVGYKRSMSAIESLLTPNGWVAVSQLDVAAPSTSTPIAPRDGNAVTNRRVMHTTLTGLNLQVGEEIMLRFSYAFNSNTNGNGLGIDDVVITPQTNVYYSSDDDSKKLDAKTSWGTNIDGTGTAPTSFALDNCIYYVQSKTPKTTRLGAAWNVTGQNSKIVVGDGTKTSYLYIGPNDNIVGPIDVNNHATLEIQHLNNTLTFGSFDAGSTVEYINASTATQSISAGSYGTLSLTQTGPRTLTGNVLVRTELRYDNGDKSPVALNGYDLQLHKGVNLSGPSRSATLFVTNGAGTLVRTVTANAPAVIFPVGTSAASFSPVTLTQGATGTEDAFKVRVMDNLYANYTATGASLGNVITAQNVKKTWLVQEEVPGSSNVTMKLQWNSADATDDFVVSKAHISHYSGGKWDVLAPASATAIGNNAYEVSRTGITSFSPFGVSSRNNPLPVELTAFGARREGAVVSCAWTTASEKNSRDFAVERSANGRDFDPVGTTAAAGSSSSAIAYIFRDKQPLASRSYYRLRQTDFDGTVAYSASVLVAGLALGAPTVVPNPGSGSFALLLPEGLTLTGPVVVRNLLGAEVLRLPADNAGTSLRFDLGQQAPGVYLVQLETAAGRRVLRVSRQ